MASSAFMSPFQSFFLTALKMLRRAESDNNIHGVSLGASKAVSGTVVTHHCHTSEECSAMGGGVVLARDTQACK